MEAPVPVVLPRADRAVPLKARDAAQHPPRRLRGGEGCVEELVGSDTVSCGWFFGCPFCVWPVTLITFGILGLGPFVDTNAYGQSPLQPGGLEASPAPPHPWNSSSFPRVGACNMPPIGGQITATLEECQASCDHRMCRFTRSVDDCRHLTHSSLGPRPVCNFVSYCPADRAFCTGELSNMCSKYTHCPVSDVASAPEQSHSSFTSYFDRPYESKDVLQRQNGDYYSTDSGSPANSKSPADTLNEEITASTVIFLVLILGSFACALVGFCFIGSDVRGRRGRPGH